MARTTTKARAKRAPSDPRKGLLADIKRLQSKITSLEGQRDACLNELYISTYGYVQHSIAMREEATIDLVCEELAQACGRHRMYWHEYYYSGQLITDERLSTKGPKTVRPAAVRWLARVRRSAKDSTFYRKALAVVRSGGTRADCIELRAKDPTARAKEARHSATVLQGKGKLTHRVIKQRLHSLAVFASVYYGEKVTLAVFRKGTDEVFDEVDA